MRGLTEKLDYVQELGVNTIWLLPFYPSPFRDDGYDVSDYHNVHPAYGTRADVRHLVREAHRRDLRVITELVVNHTSDQHPWFQAARRAPRGSTSATSTSGATTRTSTAARASSSPTPRSRTGPGTRWRSSTTGTASSSHQPDLNFDNPRVRKAVFRTMSFWLDMGVDGFRLDAIPYLIERDGTSNENLRETHEVIKEIRARLDAKYTNRLLLAEANMWPEDVREYFGDGDECHMAYHFPLMPRMYMAIAQEDRHPVVEILQQTPEIPPTCQWAMFLRNHDELTLEMVTSKERDYMYRMYAADPRARINLGIRRRLAPLMENDRDRIKLMNSLLMSMPGTPVLYYGDEIGMGDNIFLGDRDGVRTPMQWTSDRNGGFSRADPQRLYLPPIQDPIYGFEAVNVEAQARDPSSLLNWTRRLLAVRSSSKAFGRGRFTLLHPGNRKILAYLREYDEGRDPLRRQRQPLGAAGRAGPRRLQGPRAGRDDGPQCVPADRRPAVPADVARARLLLVPPGRRRRGARVAHREAARRGPAGAGAVRRLEQLLPQARRAVAHRHGRAHAAAARDRSAAALPGPSTLVREQGRGDRARAARRLGRVRRRRAHLAGRAERGGDRTAANALLRPARTGMGRHR